MQATPGSPIKAVVFDFDGTIANSLKVFIRGVEYALDRPPFTPAEIEELRQHSAREVIKMFRIPLWKIPVLAAKGTREIDRHHDEIMPFTAMPETLTKLKHDGYKLYIVSSHSAKGIARFLKKHQLDSLFEHTYSGIGLFGKAQTMKKLQSRYKYTSSECVLIGDEVRDVEAAKKAGVHSIAVAWGFNSPTVLEKHHPSVLLHKVTDLPAALKKLS